MSRTVRHLALGMSLGVTVFAIAVPLIHLLAELTVLVGVRLGTWDNPVEVFIFLVTTAMFGIFPWGLWITLTDARQGDLFDAGHEVVKYLLAAMGVFLVLTLLVCSRLQAVYAEFRWFLSPALIACAAALLYWRWRRVWGFSSKTGVRGILDCVLPVHRPS